MSYPVLEDWFSISIRRNRKSFILATLMLAVVALFVVAILALFSPKPRAFFFIVLPIALAYFLCSFLLTGQRFRDMGLTGWLALLWLPANIADAFLQGAASLALWIVLCTVPGTKGDNRYGPDPLA
jgi:uncharacterized membrane protein YhaH (DUF805 family)